MRLTRVLNQINYHRHVKRIWKKQGRLQTEDLIVPPALAELGVPIIDAKEILQETKLFKEQKPVPKILPQPPSVFKQEKYLHIMHYDTKVSENANQTLCLTKTIPYKGLPSIITSLIEKDHLPNQDELVQTRLLQAQVWDTEQVKLPKRVDPDRPCHGFRRLYGIDNTTKVISLLEKLTDLCDCATGKYPNCLDQSKLYNAFADVTILRNGDIIAFKMPADILLSSKEPLKRFSSATEVANTEVETIPNIYPIKSTLDLDKLDLMDASDNLMPHKFIGGNLHTVFVAQKAVEPWSAEQMLGRAIATCFSFCALKARQLYGSNVAVLPAPICVQCAFMDLRTFNFIGYQLNTLDLDHNEGVKNQVWIDEPSYLYEAIAEGSPVINYNPNVFSKLLALYLNGLLPVKA